jgi:hypothetical protein
MKKENQHNKILSVLDPAVALLSASLRLPSGSKSQFVQRQPAILCLNNSQCLNKQKPD